MAAEGSTIAGEYVINAYNLVHTAGASGLLLPWIEELLAEANITLQDLDAIAIGVGPGALDADQPHGFSRRFRQPVSG